MRGRVEAAVDTNARAARRALPTWMGAPAASARRLLACAAAVLGLALVSAPAARAQTTTNTSSLTPLRSPNGVITLIPNSQGISRLREYYTPIPAEWNGRFPAIPAYYSRYFVGRDLIIVDTRNDTLVSLIRDLLN